MIIAIIIIIAGGVWWQQRTTTITQDDNSQIENLQTYKNEYYGVSFKFPRNLQFVEKSTYGDDAIMINFNVVRVLLTKLDDVSKQRVQEVDELEVQRGECIKEDIFYVCHIDHSDKSYRYDKTIINNIRIEFSAEDTPENVSIIKEMKDSLEISKP